VVTLLLSASAGINQGPYDGSSLVRPGTATFDAYGNAAGTTGLATPFQFPGQHVDNESGLYHLRARLKGGNTPSNSPESAAAAVDCYPAECFNF
jgi:hypothetical protein